MVLRFVRRRTKSTAFSEVYCLRRLLSTLNIWLLHLHLVSFDDFEDFEDIDDFTHPGRYKGYCVARERPDPGFENTERF
jgi:hypothetical protein